MGRTIVSLALLIGLAGCATDAPPPQVSGRDIVLASETTVVQGLVPDRTTLDDMLRASGLAADTVQRVIAATQTVFDPRRLKSLQPFSLERTINGALRLFEYDIDTDSLLRVSSARGAEALRAEVVAIPKTLVPATIQGRIDGTTPSLFQSIDAAGERADLAIALAQVFAGEIDFNSELQPGDRYTLTFERFTRVGRADSYGVITAAEFQNDGRVLQAIRFETPGNPPSYYDAQGRSLRRFFLRSPLKFVPQVTSGFSASRMHPVLHTARAHRGVDYAAPPGAPVVAVASGRVISATIDSTNGRMVKLHHASGYDTSYLHLSAFAPGIRAGVRVDQGDLIGRVGSSGLATGPHLHYALQKNGVFVNPLNEHRNMPPGDPVPPVSMAAFGAQRDAALAELARMRTADAEASAAGTR